MTLAVYAPEGVRSAAPLTGAIRPRAEAIVDGTGGASSQRVPPWQAAEEKLSAATPTISSFVGEVKRTTPSRQSAVTQLSVPTAVEIFEVTTSVVVALPDRSAKKTASRWFSQPSSLIWSAAGEHSTVSSVEPGRTPVTVMVTDWPFCRRLVGVTLMLGLLVASVAEAARAGSEMAMTPPATMTAARIALPTAVRERCARGRHERAQPRASCATTGGK